MENQYLFYLQCFRNNAESDTVSNLLRPPMKFALNEDIIYNCVSAITKAYKNSGYSSYTKISNSVFGILVMIQ